jgi:50S ribosome-binding GTPase
MIPRRPATADRASRTRRRPAVGRGGQESDMEPDGNAAGPARGETAGQVTSGQAVGQAAGNGPARPALSVGPAAGIGSAGPAGPSRPGGRAQGQAADPPSAGHAGAPAAPLPAAEAPAAPLPAAAPPGSRLGRLPVRTRAGRAAARPSDSAGLAARPGAASRLPVRVPGSPRGPAQPSASPGPPWEAQGVADQPAGERPEQERPLASEPAGASAGERMSAAEPPAPTEAEVATGLSARLMALARMIQIGHARSGRDGFSEKLLADAEEVLARAGDRMRLSSSHTVVVLAGGTGSGKSSLFNRVAGADFSTVGVTRPVTRQAHACVWGQPGSGAIMDWLDVPARYRFSRASALDSGEDDLAGLVLLDLPDHDSVMSHAGTLVDQLVSRADVMVWVLDPQKYADAAVHRRFLVPLASHSDVLAVVLNQSDLLDPTQVDDCMADLRRLLDSENLHDVPVLVTSAVTGAGLDDLRKLLVDGVAARRAAAARISDDVDDVVTRFEPYASGAGAAPGVPASAKAGLVARLTAAAGVTAVCDALRSARELRAVDFVGWPVAWFIQRVSGRDPIRKVRLRKLWNDLRSVTAGPADAQQAEIDNALTDLGNELASPLPKPWSATVRAAVRSRADDISAAVGSAIGDALPAEGSTVWWWRLAGLWQGLLLGTAAVGLAWLLLILIFGVFHAAAGLPTLLSKVSVMPWIAAGTFAVLALGAYTSWACMRAVRVSVERESGRVTAEIGNRIAAVADEMVVIPAEQELSELARYREETEIAARGAAPGPVG